MEFDGNVYRKTAILMTGGITLGVFIDLHVVELLRPRSKKRVKLKIRTIR
jgi:hypothetical protein